MKTGILVLSLVLSLASLGISVSSAAEGDFNQPLVALSARWASYHVNRGDVLRLRVELRSASRLTREAYVEYLPGQPVQVVVDGVRTSAGAIPVAIGTAYADLAAALSTHVSTLATAGAFNAQ
jgi:hypothetical protein